MLSILLQGPGGGGGGDGGDEGGGGGYGGGDGISDYGTGGAGCDKTCIIVVSAVVSPVALLIVGPLALLALCSLCKCLAQCGAPHSIDYHRRKATLSADILAMDRSSLFLSNNALTAPTCFTVSVTSSYRGHTPNNKAELQALFDLAFDNSSASRALTASGEDGWGEFNVRGSFVLDSPTHGYLAFFKAYAQWHVFYAGEFDASQQPLEVRGSWYTPAGTKDGGPFTMTFAAPLSIIDTAPAAAAVVVDVSAAACNLAQPPALQAPGDAAEADAEMHQASQQPPPPYHYPHVSEPSSGAGSSECVVDVEMVQLRLPHDFGS